MKLLQILKQKKNHLLVFGFVLLVACIGHSLATSARVAADGSDANLTVTPIVGHETSDVLVTWTASNEERQLYPGGSFVFFVLNASDDTPIGNQLACGILRNASAVVPITNLSTSLSGMQPGSQYQIATKICFNDKTNAGDFTVSGVFNTATTNTVAPTPGGGNGGVGTTPSTNLSVSLIDPTTGGDKSMGVKWLQIKNAVKYMVEYTSNTAAHIQSGTDYATGLGVTLTGLYPSTSYTVKVTALDASGKVLASQSRTAPTDPSAGTPAPTGCTSKNLAAAGCTASAAACKSAGGNYARLSKDVYACYNNQTYCVQVLGGKWTANACKSPDPSKVCTAVGLAYKSGSCVGTTDPTACTNLPTIGGVQAICKGAVANPPSSNPAPGTCGHGGSFFALPTWYEYLPRDNADCTVTFCVLGNGQGGCTKSSIPLVLLAVVDIALRIGSLVALGFVIYGAIRFTLSQGEPDGVKSARNTIINALVGLTITIIATPLVSFLGNRFGA